MMSQRTNYKYQPITFGLFELINQEEFVIQRTKDHIHAHIHAHIMYTQVHTHVHALAYVCSHIHT